MNNILSQNEIDALLNAVGDSGAPSDGASDSSASGAQNDSSSGSESSYEEPPVEENDIQPYDLTNQDRVIRGRMPTLDIIYERFVRLFRMSLSNSLRKIASMSIISTDLLKFGEFVNTLPIPSCMCIMRLEALRGPALLVFESKLAYALVDSYLGGTDRPFTKIEGKEFTRIELSIMRKVMDLALKDLEDAWAPVHKVDASFLRIEVNPQFVGVVPPSDVIITTTFEVELETASGTIVLVIPYSTIESIKGKLNSSYQMEGDRSDKEWVGMMEEHLKNTMGNVVVNLGEAQITVGDLVNLSAGDVLPLNKNADDELEILVEGVPKYKCFFGVSRGSRAVQITRLLDQE